MRVRVLGCSGGIGGRHMRTTSMLVDHDILVDAGTGVADLSLAEMVLIDHVFVTHEHLDHIVSIPFLVDTVGAMRNKPLVIHALKETIDTLKKHIMNWRVWPDFTVIPTAEQPFLKYEPITLGQTVDVNGRKFTALPANHVVPAIGYAISNDKSTLVFSGDTTTNDDLWKIVNKIPSLKAVIIETAFCNREKDLAIASKHLCPSMLAEELGKLDRRTDIFVTHLKPGEIELTMQEIEEYAGQYSPRMLQNGHVFEL